jgi:hypothetical protein
VSGDKDLNRVGVDATKGEKRQSWMRIKRSILKKAELIVYIAFVIVGVFLTTYGSMIYNGVLFSREPEIPKGLCVVCVTQIEEINSLWATIWPPDATDMRDNATVLVDLLIYLNTSDVANLAALNMSIFDVNIIVPGIADNLVCKGSGLAFIAASATRLYDESTSSTMFTFQWKINYDPYGDHLPVMSIGPVTFEWRILMRESYDKFGMMTPIPPSQALWGMDYDLYHIHEYRLMVTLGDGESLDLSETFPAPQSYTRGYSSISQWNNVTLLPTYKWKFAEDELSMYDWLTQGEAPFVRELTHVVISLDVMRLEKERILFTSGTYFGLGTSTILTGVYSLLQMLAYRGKVTAQKDETSV